MLQVFDDGSLWQRSGGQRSHKFKLLHLCLVTTRHGPANAVAGRQTLRKRAAVQYKLATIERLSRARAGPAEVELCIHVVLNKWHVMTCQQADQSLFFGIGHQTAKRVLEGGDQNAG